MQPINYLTSPAGIVWTIICVPLGFVLTALAYFIINRIPAKWLCDYDDEPSEELLSGKRVDYLPSGIVISVVMSLCLVLCRLQFNKGYTIYFVVLSLIIFVCLLIAIADFKYQIIPDEFTIAAGVLALGVTVYDLVRGYHIFHFVWWSPVLGAVIGAASMLIINFIGMLVYKRDGMGFGDVKLFLALGILTGFPGTIYTFIISILTATVFFVAIILISKIVHKDAEQPEYAATDDISGKEEQSPEFEKVSTGTETVPSDESEIKKVSADTAAPSDDESKENAQDDDIGFGSYLAFGPYIAAAVTVYIVLFDTVQFLAQLYLNLF